MAWMPRIQMRTAPARLMLALWAAILDCWMDRLDGARSAKCKLTAGRSNGRTWVVGRCGDERKIRNLGAKHVTRLPRFKNVFFESLWQYGTMNTHSTPYVSKWLAKKRVWR